MTTPAPFYYSRDHDAGPGRWCVRGPQNFMMPVPDKALAAAIGEMMSGNWDKAKEYMDALALWDGEVIKIVAKNARYSHYTKRTPKTEETTHG